MASCSNLIEGVLMRRFTHSILLLTGFVVMADAEEPTSTHKVVVGGQAPAFKIKDATGKNLNLAELTAKGPVLVRLTCGCAGSDKEIAYFQQIHDTYKNRGLTSLFIFREPDAKVAQYAVDRKLGMLYAVDPKGQSWKVFETTTMRRHLRKSKKPKLNSDKLSTPFHRR
jgi:peroxiredoxin